MASISSEYNFIGIYDQLLNLNYWQTEPLQTAERNLYAELEKSQDNIVGLIVMMRCQIMLGNITKAKALAHKIWSIGGEISPVMEYAFVENLLNVGLLDMAMVLLKPRLTDMRTNLGIFAPLVAKFAVMTGNLNILEKLAVSSGDEYYRVWEDFSGAYKALKYSEHFNNMQKLIFDTIKDRLASYEYNLYFDRGFTDLETVLYLIDEVGESAKVEQALNRKIEAYFVSAGVKQLHNYSVKVHNIKEHRALFQMEI